MDKQVCEKVQGKGRTTYNEVADELVKQFSNPENLEETDQVYDEKNIRRRVYDALNVLMALNIITKQKKEIIWKGYPSSPESNLEKLRVRPPFHRNSHIKALHDLLQRC
jgi:hypothetical protein